MNTKTRTIWLAGLCFLAVSACSSTDSNRYSSTSSPSNSSMSDGAISPSANSSADNSSTRSSTSAGYMSSTSPQSTSSSTAPPPASSTGSTSSTATTSGMDNNSMANTSSTATGQTSYGTVQAIDQMQRQDVGVGAVGAAAAGGSMGAPTDKVYRVTVRMDDGTSQMVVVDSMPNYVNGDRVRYHDGILQKY